MICSSGYSICPFSPLFIPHSFPFVHHWYSLLDHIHGDYIVTRLNPDDVWPIDPFIIVMIVIQCWFYGSIVSILGMIYWKPNSVWYYLSNLLIFWWVLVVLLSDQYCYSIGIILILFEGSDDIVLTLFGNWVFYDDHWVLMMKVVLLLLFCYYWLLIVLLNYSRYWFPVFYLFIIISPIDFSCLFTFWTLLIRSVLFWFTSGWWSLIVTFRFDLFGD